MQIQISWLLQKPTDLDRHCLQRQTGFSRTMDNFKKSCSRVEVKLNSCRQQNSRRVMVVNVAAGCIVISPDIHTPDKWEYPHPIFFSSPDHNVLKVSFCDYLVSVVHHPLCIVPDNILLTLLNEHVALISR